MTAPTLESASIAENRIKSPPSLILNADQFSPVHGHIKPHLNPNPNPSHNVNSDAPVSRAGSLVALSGQSALGSGSSKVSKRKPRANNKNPIKFFSADAQNFMAMVQKLTGIPPNSPYPSTSLGSAQNPSSSSSPLWNPASNRAMQGLWTPTFSFDNNAMVNTNTISRIPRFTSSPNMPTHSGPTSTSSLPSKLGLNREGGNPSSKSFSPINDFDILFPHLLGQNTNKLGPSCVTGSIQSCSTASLPNLWDPLEEQIKLKQEPSMDNFSDHGVLGANINGSLPPHQDIIDELDHCATGQFPSWENVLMENVGQDSWSLLQNAGDGKPS